ncbi:DUF2951 family protein [Staphylococcus succinus]|uniref:DUF2951 family protein n=1 Tax=Staphylococcus succinus TaxID=61015 RepID=UPI003F5566FF
MSASGTGDVERRIGILEEKDRYNDKRFKRIEETAKQDKKEVDNTIKKLYDSLREIEKGQHTQELTNQKMDFTLDSINREREIEKQNKEENRREFKQLKWLITGTVATLLGSLILAFVRSWLGI